MILYPLKKTLNFLLPPRCIACDDMTSANHMLCAKCWGQVTFITDPKCDTCGLPFEVDFEEEGHDDNEKMLCASCIQDPPFYDQARALFVYGGTAKSIILKLKHGDATYLAPGFANLFYPRFQDFIAPIDLIVPVPIHRRRLLQRWYNQAGLLAQSLGKQSHKPVNHFLLKRVKHTPPQGKMNKTDRTKNVKNAVILNESLKPNAHILLIDDVMTTGATVNECAKILKKSGAKKVDILTVARVV